MKKLIIILISLLSISGSLTAKVYNVLVLGENSYTKHEYYGIDNLLKKGEDLSPYKCVKLDKENYIELHRECFDYIETDRTVNRHYTGYSKTTGTSSSGYFLIKKKFLGILDLVTRNWDKELHGIDYCKLTQEDKQFVTDHFDHFLIKAYIRILSPMPIPEVMKALNIDISDKELTALNLNDEVQMINIERLLRYWFEPHCRPKISFKTTR